MTGHERSGWRDEDLSRRHRCWGPDVPAQDIDALVAAVGEQLNIFGHIWLEYDRHEPVALGEWKAGTAPRDQHQDRALIALADRANLPALLFRYWKAPVWTQLWHFWVMPLNRLGVQWVSTGGLEMGEADVVWLLYKMRDRTPPDQIVRWLDGLIDPDDPNDGRPF
jgi:hypothetical protein